MWPGQQPPGGENPQQPNPYHQPGYHQPNPYLRPEQQPTAPQYAVPAPPPGGPRPPKDERRRTVLVAIAAATAVLATAVVTGVVVLGGEDGAGDDGASGRGGGADRSSAARSPAGDTGAEPGAGTGNPRGVEEIAPTVKGWKVVSNPRHGTRFDVPPNWEVVDPGVSTFVEDWKKGDGSPLVTMSGPAYFTPRWCTADSDDDGVEETAGLATVGTKGGKGAKDTAGAAATEAGFWVWGAFAQREPKGTVETAPAKPYTTASGLTGSMATATAVGVKKRSKCSTDGKSVAFTFKDATGEFRSWILYAAKGVPGEVPDAVIRKILSTLRLAGKPTG